MVSLCGDGLPWPGSGARRQLAELLPPQGSTLLAPGSLASTPGCQDQQRTGPQGHGCCSHCSSLSESMARLSLHSPSTSYQLLLLHQNHANVLFSLIFELFLKWLES